MTVQLPMASAMAGILDLAVWECWIAVLDTTMGEGARSLDLKVARILPKVVVTTWKVHQLWEILPTTTCVPGYFENPITQQRLSHV
jgi:hypothetical protein